MNLLITPAQAIGHKIPELETSSWILWKSGNKKWWVFLKKLIIGNLVCIKACYSFKPAKPFQWPKIQVPKSWYSEITLINALGHVDQKFPISREYFWVIPFLWTEMTWITLWSKDDPFQNNSHIRNDASTWKVVYGMLYCPE